MFSVSSSHPMLTTDQYVDMRSSSRNSSTEDHYPPPSLLPGAPPPVPIHGPPEDDYVGPDGHMYEPQRDSAPLYRLVYKSNVVV